ncbi:hypothetical protein QL285_064410 [Trifolium repens]|jgi:hypothetical protein|nr:hypothetical protein QL285_064410 [Trifolium repens]
MITTSLMLSYSEMNLMVRVTSIVRGREAYAKLPAAPCKWKQPEDGILKQHCLMRSILSFSDEDYIGGKPNKTFPMVIMAMIANHDSSRVIVDKGNSCYIFSTLDCDGRI